MLFAGCSSVTDSNVDELGGIETSAFTDAAESKTSKSNYKDEDNNGIPDEGEVVTGAYKSVYAFDATGSYYWDLGDGRVQGDASSIADLDQATLSVCDYKVVYRATFGNDPFMDTGWIRNNIKCNGYSYDKAKTYNYLIVHETDHRYSEDAPEIWGSWAYFVDTESGVGNKLAGPKTPQN